MHQPEASSALPHRGPNEAPASYRCSYPRLAQVVAGRTAAKAIGQELLVVSATSDRDFEAAFASIVQHRAGALLIGQDPFLFQAGGQLVALSARHRIPAIYGNSESVSAGALISYGASLPDAWRRVSVYTGRILKGAKPGDLPVEQPTKFELVINLKAAKQIGLTIPPNVLARADKVIK